MEIRVQGGRGVYPPRPKANDANSPIFIPLPLPFLSSPSVAFSCLAPIPIPKIQLGGLGSVLSSSSIVPDP